MLGSKKIEIGPREFMRGMSTSQYTEDGFFSPNSFFGLNLSAVPGVIWGQYPSTLIDSGVSERYIASCIDSTDIGKKKYLVTTLGNFYSYTGAAKSLEFTENTKTYTYGKTDLVQYKGFLYCTSSVDITRATVGAGGSLSAATPTWWTVTRGHSALNASFIHCMVVYEDNLWIADINGLHKWDGTTSSTFALQLTSDQAITALGIDPSSGKMLIATTQGPNFSNTSPKVNKILIWDGFSNKPLRSVIVDDMVTCFYSMGGMVYIGYGKNLGYWNGSGVSFLRRLANIESQTSGDYLMYKPHITNIGSCLYFVDGDKVYAYESLQSGSQKVFYPAYSSPDFTPLEGIDLIDNLGGDNLIVTYRRASGTSLVQNYKTKTVNVNGDQNLNFTTREFVFSEFIKIKAVRIIFYSIITATTKNPITISAGSNSDSIVFEDWFTDGTTGQTYHDFLPRSSLDDKLMGFSLNIYKGNDEFPGIRKIIIYYDNVE